MLTPTQLQKLRINLYEVDARQARKTDTARRLNLSLANEVLNTLTPVEAHQILKGFSGLGKKHLSLLNRVFTH